MLLAHFRSPGRSARGARYLDSLSYVARPGAHGGDLPAVPDRDPKPGRSLCAAHTAHQPRVGPAVWEFVATHWPTLLRAVPGQLDHPDARDHPVVPARPGRHTSAVARGARPSAPHIRFGRPAAGRGPAPRTTGGERALRARTAAASRVSPRHEAPEARAPDELRWALSSRADRLLAAARAAKGFMPDDEGLALAAVAERAAAGFSSIVEVGAYCGRSTLYLAVRDRARSGSGRPGP